MRVRIAAAHAIADLASERSLSKECVRLLTSWLHGLCRTKPIGTSNKGGVRLNQFDNFEEYFLQRGVVSAFSSIRDQLRHTPISIVKEVLDLLKFNDNSMNKVGFAHEASFCITRRLCCIVATVFGHPLLDELAAVLGEVSFTANRKHCSRYADALACSTFCISDTTVCVPSSVGTTRSLSGVRQDISFSPAACDPSVSAGRSTHELSCTVHTSPCLLFLVQSYCALEVHSQIPADRALGYAPYLLSANRGVRVTAFRCTVNLCTRRENAIDELLNFVERERKLVMCQLHLVLCIILGILRTPL